VRERQGPGILGHALEEALPVAGVGDPVGDRDQVLPRSSDGAPRGSEVAGRVERLGEDVAGDAGARADPR
jgi:hypothetical protein